MKWLILLTIVGYEGNTLNLETGERFDNLGECLERATSDDFRQAVIEIYKDKGIQMVHFNCTTEDSDKMGA